MESRFGINKEADLIKCFNKFTNTTRASSQDLLMYVNAFELAYTDLQKLVEELSQTFLTLFLLTNANLPDVDFQIITSQLDFNKRDELFNEAKAALRRHQYCKIANTKHQPHSGPGEKFSENQITLLSTLFPDQEINQDTLEGFRSYLSKEHDRKKRPFKCWKCLCKCPRNKICDCECSKHPYWKCKERKDKPDEREDDDNDSEKNPKPSKLLYGTSQYESDFQSHLDDKQVFIANNPKPCNSRKRRIHPRANKLQDLLTYQAQDRKTKVSTTTDVVHLRLDYTLLTRGSQIEKGNLSFIIDTGAPHSLMGIQKFQKMFEQYLRAIAVQFNFQK